jgi:hypothetical protein
MKTQMATKETPMDKMIVYFDDAGYALQLLQPMLMPARRQAPTLWVLVGCAPRVTHHVSKWVTRSARESWRGKWAEKAFEDLVPVLGQGGDQVRTCMATTSLIAQTESLIKVHGPARVLDARRPKVGQNLQPVTAAQLPEQRTMLAMVTVAAGVGLLGVVD